MRVGFVVFGLAVAVSSVTADDRPVPKYEGKPLDYWVAKLERPADDKERDEASKALEAFGKDAAPAIPRLLVMLEDKSPEYTNRVRNVFLAMGAAAKPAVPTLAKKLADDDYAYPEDALQIVEHIGPAALEAVPALAQLLGRKGIRPQVRWDTVHALCVIGPDGGKESVSAIVSMLRSKPGEFSVVAGYLPRLKAAIVPGLVGLIEHPVDGVDVAGVADCLGKIGRDANAAAPMLRKLLLSPDEMNALRADYVEQRMALFGVRPTATAEPIPQARPSFEEQEKTRRLNQRRLIAFRAAISLAEIGDGEPAVELLAVTLASREGRESISAAHALEKLGRLAAPAVPALKERLAEMEEHWPPSAGAYRDALRAIARAQAEKK